MVKQSDWAQTTTWVLAQEKFKLEIVVTGEQWFIFAHLRAKLDTPKNRLMLLERKFMVFKITGTETIFRKILESTNKRTVFAEAHKIARLLDVS